MYLSKITLETRKLSPDALLKMVEKGEYAMHQWLWELFPAMKERHFLYRREELQGAFRFYVLSEALPVHHPLFDIESREFLPLLTPGQRLCFSLRSNPVICRAGKRHDILMDVKYQLRDKASAQEILQEQQNVAHAWLAREGDTHGFTPVSSKIEVYRQQIIAKAKGELIRYSTVDFSGLLDVNDPTRFMQKLVSGFGKSKAFGCGLMLIKPESFW
ncbi:type I-E CRISPR-associated protein Cas6/Cse3/CasE [Atlantibacter subterraneus]|uniref:type I-E CRISPR-associated protein Cas6/Cse3/CasE n=1 Tax=Atlantibacter subterraneus TaxID=255519 RepID=UPI002965287A|nr:type I-E CRISPR-associated protein Cas6/Cse3/CasE [Atlantibacter subterranea]MDW2741845.1 type I-E CRISPR-associated protein Cas6/Cse3/CasE [Atlantibacter subterranea]